MPHAFFPLIKADQKNRLVYLRGAAEELDKAGEIMDYASAKPQFQAWSERFVQATGGLSKGNVRAMHNPRHVAGKVVEMTFNDAEKAVDFVFKVVDENDWKKVEEGVYTGASIGGGYHKRWDDPVAGVNKRYTPRIAEISLVDSPCIGSALIMDLQKADGEVVEVLLKGQPRTFSEMLPPLTFGDRMAKSVLGSNAGMTKASPCWSGFVQRGMKAKGKKQVPNCVPAQKAELIDQLRKQRAMAVDRATAAKARWTAEGHKPLPTGPTPGHDIVRWHAAADAQDAYDHVRPHLDKKAGLMMEVPHQGGAIYNPEKIGDHEFAKDGSPKRDLYMLHPSEAQDFVARYGNKQPTHQVKTDHSAPRKGQKAKPKAA